MTYDLILPLDAPAIPRSEASPEALATIVADITYKPTGPDDRTTRCDINWRGGRPSDTTLDHLSAALRGMPAPRFQIHIDEEFVPSRPVHLWSTRAGEIIRSLSMMRKTPRTRWPDFD